MSDDAEFKKQRDRRNMAIGLSVAGFAVLVFLVTMMRLYVNIKAGAP